MKPNTPVVYLVVGTLAATVLAGMYSTHTLIIAKVDAALIAIVAGFTGTALGLLGSILSRTGSTPDSPAQTKIVNTPSEPVPTEPQ